MPFKINYSNFKKIPVHIKVKSLRHIDEVLKYYIYDKAFRVRSHYELCCDFH